MDMPMEMENLDADGDFTERKALGNIFVRRALLYRRYS